jgi:putative flavoprotein involved in K+ transport
MSSDDDTMTLESAAYLIEEGNAAMTLVGLETRSPAPRRERYDVIVIGGGQAGLSVGYHLARAGVRFTILDANARVGDSWRKRWDSLRLFSHAKFDGLDGMPFPAPRNSFPTKDQMADYLEAYARRFGLPVRTGVRVERLYKCGGRFVARSGALEIEADQVVVAMADYQVPKVPAFAHELSHDIVQMTSTQYRNPAQLKPGGVLLVGAGNTGADIAMETARSGHPTWLAGPDVGAVPFRPEGIFATHVLMPVLFRAIFHRLLTLATPIGRRLRAKGHRATPLIRVKPRDLAAAGVRRVPRVVGVRDGRPVLEDGWALDVANVIWSAGFHRGFDWIDLPVFGGDGAPAHERGLVEREPGLYFVGLTFLYAMSSSMIQGVGRDAARIVEAVTARIEPALSDAESPPSLQVSA